jgi:hypothetical protein
MSDASLTPITPITPSNDPTDADAEVALEGGERASDTDLIAGIIAQTRSDYRGTDLDEISARLRQRFEQSEVAVDDDALAVFAQEIADAAR